MDLDLNFLSGFVNQQLANGKPAYDKSKSMLLENVGHAVPTAQLNFEAYKPEQPTFATVNQPSGATGQWDG